MIAAAIWSGLFLGIAGLTIGRRAETALFRRWKGVAAKTMPESLRRSRRLPFGASIHFMLLHPKPDWIAADAPARRLRRRIYITDAMVFGGFLLFVGGLVLSNR